MGLFARLFKKSEPHQEITKTSSETLDDNESEMKWKAVPAYIEASEEEYQLVSLIATAIAAGDQPKSQFVVKKVMQRNPEAKLKRVSLLFQESTKISILEEKQCYVNLKFRLMAKNI